MVPQVSLAPQFLSARLIEPVGQFKDLVHEEGEHVQEKEVVGEMALAMPVVMLDMIAMVLDDIEDLVFDLPSHPVGSQEYTLSRIAALTHASHNGSTPPQGGFCLIGLWSF